MRLIVSPQAAVDLQRLHVFLLDRNPAAAQRAITTLEAAIQSLEHFPDRGRPAKIPGLRELVVPFGQSAYVLRYAYFAEPDEVVILRIWHAREQRE